jgi:hypothetical protein
MPHGLAIHSLRPENTPMHRTTEDEQGQFGFLPIFLVAAAVALTAAAITIACILSWVYLREHNSGVVSGVFPQSAGHALKAAACWVAELQ